MLFSQLAGLVAVSLLSTLSAAQTYDGVATYYYQEGAAGSCGDYHQDSDYIVAISEDSPFYDNEYCGRTVTITNMGGGQDNNGEGNTIQATVADTCPSCADTHLDLSVGAFEGLTGGNLDPPGTFNIQWNFD